MRLPKIGTLVVFSLAAVLLGSLPARGEDAVYTLQSGRKASDIDRVTAVLEAGGSLSLAEGEDVKSLDMSVVGELRYDERLLAGDPHRRDELRSVRHYEQAVAAIKIDKGGLKPTLRASRGTIVVDASQDEVAMFSPLGPLSREELDLIEIPLNSLLVETLLPTRPVAVGEAWSHDAATISALLGLDAVNQTDAASTLTEVIEKAVKIELAGTVQGAIGGVSTDIEIKARYKFDLEHNRITWLAILIKEKRSIGHVGPGLDLTARLQLHINKVASSPRLNPAAIEDFELVANPSNMLLAYESLDGKLAFYYDRRWHVMADDPGRVTMRFVDRGELLAQSTVASLPDVPAGTPTTLAKFQEDIKRSLGESFDQFAYATSYESGEGLSTHRVVAMGEMSDLPIQWNYYLTADKAGRQAVCAFTLESELVERFADADQPLVASLELLGGADETADRSTPGRTRQ